MSMRGLVLFAIVAGTPACAGLLDLQTVRFESDDSDSALAADASDASSSPDGGDASIDAPPSTVSFLVWPGGSVPNVLGEDFPSAEVLIARVKDDGSLDEWKSGPNLPKALFKQTAVGMDGHVYVLGGGQTLAGSASQTIYDITIDADGNAKVDVSASTSFHAVGGNCATAANGRLYLLFNSGSTLDSAPVVSGTFGQWVASEPIGADELLAQPIVATPKAVFAQALSSGTKKMESLTLGATFEPPTTNAAWTPLPLAPHAFNGSSFYSPLATDGAHVYAVGTFADNGDFETRVMGRSVTDGSAAWEDLEPFLDRRRNQSAVAVGGRLYVVGGSDEGGPVQSVSYASILSDGKLSPWTKTTSLPSPRAGTCNLAAVTVPRK